MLEIIALIYLSGKLGNLAVQKGLKKGLWRFYMIAAWFGAEILGIAIGMLVFHIEEIFTAVIIGWGCAILSYLILQGYLKKLPDVTDGFEFEQLPSQEQHN